MPEIDPRETPWKATRAALSQVCLPLNRTFPVRSLDQ